MIKRKQINHMLNYLRQGEGNTTSLFDQFYLRLVGRAEGLLVQDLRGVLKDDIMALKRSILRFLGDWA